MKNIFVFEYNSNSTLDLRDPNVGEKAFERVMDYFKSVTNTNNYPIIEKSFQKFRRTAVDLWKLTFELIDSLQLPSSKTSYVVFSKVLGYDMIIDEGMGVMYGSGGSNIRTQAVHFDVRKIRVLEMLDNKKEQPMDRISADRENIEYAQKRDQRNRKAAELEFFKLDLEDAKRRISDPVYPQFANSINKMMRNFENSDQRAMAVEFYNQLRTFASRVELTEELPSEEEIYVISSASRVFQNALGLGGKYLEELALLNDVDLIFDIKSDFVDVYKNAASQAASQLR